MSEHRRGRARPVAKEDKPVNVRQDEVAGQELNLSLDGRAKHPHGPAVMLIAGGIMNDTVIRS
jgi:hypothetical protein